MEQRQERKVMATLPKVSNKLPSNFVRLPLCGIGAKSVSCCCLLIRHAQIKGTLLLLVHRELANTQNCIHVPIQ